MLDLMLLLMVLLLPLQLVLIPMMIMHAGIISHTVSKHIKRIRIHGR